MNGINSLRQDEVFSLLPKFVAAAKPEDWAAVDLSKASVAFPVEVTAWIDAEARAVPRAAADLDLASEPIGPAAAAGAGGAGGGANVNTAAARAPTGAHLPHLCGLHIDLSYIMTFLEYKCRYPQVLILIKRHITARFPGCVCLGTPLLVFSSVVCSAFLIGVLYDVRCGSNVTSPSLSAAPLIHVLCQVQELHSSTASMCLAVCLQRRT